MRGDHEYFRIFTEYIDQNLSRDQGRRLRMEYCVKNPVLTELKLAVQKLNWDYSIQEKSKYPKSWWIPRGMILVKKSERSKLSTIKQLSLEIRDSIRPALERKKQELAKQGKKKVKKSQKNVHTAKKTHSRSRRRR